MKHDIIVLGGGASGIMAALTSKDLGGDVAIVEGENRIGKKLLVTGNGRCNITNSSIKDNSYHSDNPTFYKSILEAFDLKATISFFETLGLPLRTLEEGKMYPLSLQASSVLDILRMAILERNIPIYTDSKIQKIMSISEGFLLKTTSGTEFYCRKIILATGGKAFPSSGSDGSGLKLAKELGHKIIKTVPALVQLKLDYIGLKALSGIKFDGVAAIIVKGDILRSEAGEILFTDYGISGPPILQLSRNAAIALSKGEKVIINVDILPQMNKNELQCFLEAKWSLFESRSIHDSLIGVINKKMIPILLKEAGIADIHTPTSFTTYKERLNIIRLLKNWEFKVQDTNSFANAQVTVGGVDTKEVSMETLESLVIPGLFFAGEVLDVDGDCGGYNLQWAWSSGAVAGKNACGH